MCVGLGMGATVIWENPHHPEYTDNSGARPGGSAATETASEGAA